MKPSGGLTYVTGPMGSGKSYFAVRKMAEALLQRKYVVTNVPLSEDFAERITRHVPQSHIFPWTRKKRIELLQSLYIFEEDIKEAIRFAPPRPKKPGNITGLFVWDEFHNDVNNRDWLDDKDNRGVLNQWSTQMRKLGIAGVVLSQHADNTDTAWRRIANFEVRLRNQRDLVRVLGMRVSPIPFFIAHWMPKNTQKINRGDNILHTERYFLGWEKKLYDTLGTFHGISDKMEEITAGFIELPEPGTLTKEIRKGWTRNDSMRAVEVAESGENPPEFVVIGAK